MPVAKETQQGNAEYSLSRQDKYHERPIPYNWHLLHYLLLPLWGDTAVSPSLISDGSFWLFHHISHVLLGPETYDFYMASNRKLCQPLTFSHPNYSHFLNPFVSNYVKSVKLRGQDIKTS